MKRLITLAFVLVSLTASAWEVPKYYMKPLEQDPRAVVLKPVSVAFNSIYVAHAWWDTPCDGWVDILVTASSSSSQDREFALTVTYSTTTHSWLYILPMPAGTTNHYVFVPTNNYSCVGTISASVSWYYN